MPINFATSLLLQRKEYLYCMKAFCFITILLSGIFSNCFGQNTLGLPEIINYTKNDFHGGSQTWCISQDKEGIMYFANNEGLITFDGNYWKVYPLPNKTIMRSLAVASDGKIFVGGQGEIGYFFPDGKGILKYTSLLNRIPNHQSTFADIWKIETYNESVFFQASDRIFEYRNSNIKVHLPIIGWQYMKKLSNRLFAQDRTHGLFEFKNNKWYPLKNQNIAGGDIELSGCIPTGKDSVLLTSKKNGLFFLSNDSLSRSKGLPPDNFINHIYTSTRINETEFVAGTTSHGCLILDFKGNIIQKISTEEGLQNNNVLSVFLDKNQNLWAGLNNGISFIAYNSAIKYIKPSKENELSGYSSIIFGNKLYIGTSDGTYTVPLNNLNKDLSFSKGTFTQIKNTSGEAWRIEEVNQQLLIGHNDGVFSILNSDSKPVALGNGCWLFLPLTSVLPANNILVGTYTGLQMLGYEQGHFINKGALIGLHESFRFIAIDNNDEIWASHPYRGIYRISLSGNKSSYSAKLFTQKDGLPSTLENYVFKIKNKIVFGTSKGIYEFDKTSQKFIPSSFLTPVFKNMEVRYMREDNDGNIWFCIGKKIAVAVVNKKNPSTYNITFFPELSGQILSGFENIYPYNNENIFIGSEKGIIHLNFAKYVANKLQLKVLLGEVKAIGNNDSLLFGGYFNHTQDLAYGQQDDDILHLPNSFNSFHFEYSSPAYGLQENIEYSYQLQGFDDQWSQWSPKTEKDYTNLPAGKYVFNIKAHDNLGHESAIVSYSFVVEPAWYYSIWAKIFYILIIIFLLYLFYKFQQKKLYLQQKKFEEEQQRLKDAHQLMIEKNEKEIIKLQNEKLSKEVKFKTRELAGATLHIVERTDALSKVKEELQTLYKKTGNNHDVKKTLQLLNDIEKNNSNWEQFASHFDEVNNDFLKKIKNKYPLLSKTDLKVCAYLQLNLSTKEIAQLMNISVRGVEIGRYRLRKKLQLTTNQSLNSFLNNIS